MSSTLLQNFVGVSLILATVATSQMAQAQSDLAPSRAAIDPTLMQQGLCTRSQPGITETSILQNQDITEPSLWWIRDQIAAQNKYSTKLIDNWLACKPANEANRVDVLVNSQLWSSLDFFDRYEFIQRFGTVATGFGYNLRVVNPQGNLLAAYTCSYDTSIADKQAEPKAAPVQCTTFDAAANTNFWSPTQTFSEFSPTGSGIAR